MDNDKLNSIISKLKGAVGEPLDYCKTPHLYISLAHELREKGYKNELIDVWEAWIWRTYDENVRLGEAICETYFECMG